MFGVVIYRLHARPICSTFRIYDGHMPITIPDGYRSSPHTGCIISGAHASIIITVVYIYILRHLSRDVSVIGKSVANYADRFPAELFHVKNI